jgi:LacI family transcriptional regulator
VESAALAGGLSIPDDVAILGAGDDEPLCEAQIVAISSVQHDLERIGCEGARLLDAIMHGKPPPSKAKLIPPRGITERASTDTLAVSSGLGRRAKDIYIRELANPPSTEILATRLGVSRATLDRALAADIGISPAKLLARLRLDEAKRLLRTSGLSVSEIAYKVGYCNPAYFVNTFRRATGSPPRTWREGNRTTC